MTLRRITSTSASRGWAKCLKSGYRHADRVLAISGWAGDRVRQIAGPNLGPIDIVYNGIDREGGGQFGVRSAGESSLAAAQKAVHPPAHMARG